MSETYPSYAALMLRVGTGVLFVAHGLLKLIVFTPAGTADYFKSLGVPGPLAYPIMVLEILGGLVLIVGFKTRWLSVVLAVELLCAAAFGHAANGWMFANTGGGWEFPVFWAVVMLALALLGDGAYALKRPQ